MKTILRNKNTNFLKFQLILIKIDIIDHQLKKKMACKNLFLHIEGFNSFIMIEGNGVATNKYNKGREGERLRKRVCLPSDPARNSYPGSVGAGLGLWWTVAARGRSLGSSNPNQNGMHGTWLHLTSANDCLGSPRFASTTTTTFCSLVHVQLTRLRGASTSSHRAATTAATSGTLNSSPHALHSTTCVQLKILHPTPPAPTHHSAILGSPRFISAIWKLNSSANRIEF